MATTEAAPATYPPAAAQVRFATVLRTVGDPFSLIAFVFFQAPMYASPAGTTAGAIAAPPYAPPADISEVVATGQQTVSLGIKIGQLRSVVADSLLLSLPPLLWIRN
jgi:hypothetical protein